MIMPLQPSIAPELEARKDPDNFENAEASLGVTLNALQKLGGFDLIESTTIEGVQNLNPERKARKKIFLQENNNKPAREALKKTLQLWMDVLNSTDDIAEMVESCQERSGKTEQLLRKNLKT